MADQRASFSSMDESSAQDWAIIGSHFMPFASGVADRVLARLYAGDGAGQGEPNAGEGSVTPER